MKTACIFYMKKDYRSKIFYHLVIDDSLHFKVMLENALHVQFIIKNINVSVSVGVSVPSSFQ